MPKLVVLNHLTPERLERLQRVRPDATVEAYAKMSEALPHLEDADAVALWGSMDPLPVLEAAPKLRWLHSMSAGIEKLLPPPMQQNDIVLTHTAAIHDAPVAERALALLLALRHQLKHAVTAQAEKNWDPQSFTSLENTNVLIAGFGGIGKEIAKRCAAFGAEIIAVKNHLTEEALADRVITNDELMSVLPEADVVMCALPGTPETEGYFGAKEIAAMKKGAYFINIARGTIVDEAALIEALQSGHVAGAGLDVTAREPLPEDSPLWTLDNVILTPHTAARVYGYMDKVLNVLADNWQRFLSDQKLKNIIDKKRGY